jgi:2-C-methyl-D-erythritol 2,4-cyclodiphosphate synthase
MFRVGMGYDSHRFAEDRRLVLGGVSIDGHAGLAGHSDADVVLHAVTDAVLGAIAAGDIGELFPDTDEQWRDADSSRFVARAVALAAERGARVVNCDVTVLTESPRLSSHKAPMRSNIAALLKVTDERVSVKAKTNEHMGFVGRGEGIAAMAIVMLELRPPPRRPNAERQT